MPVPVMPTPETPQFLHAAGLTNKGAIVVTQPRRVAAITVAQRVAAEMGETVGGVVRALASAAALPPHAACR